jgi:arabinofuranan 3-O-arabinosyltransferase
LRRPVARTGSRRVALFEHLVLAAGAFVSQLLARPGVIEADTKTYLYVDPGRYLRQSASMWDPTVGLGTVTHQQIGYLFPMGPFFWATHALGIPVWVAQRLWVGAILLAAGAGAWRLCRMLGLAGPGRFVASAAYMLSPYSLQYIGHISVILLAFAALPWLVVLVDAAGRGGWRPVAAAALVVAGMGSVNATSAIYVGVGPVLWLAYAGATGRFSWAQAWRALWRCGLAAGLVSAWWVAGLAVEGAYGIDVLRYTETVQAVSTTSLSSEVVRGLGYWYFYGGDNFGPWVSAMPQFTQQLWLLGVGYALPLLGVAGTVLVHYRHRVFLLAMVVVGAVLAVGAHPLASPSPVGRLLRALFSSSTVGLALRSTDRATPLVVLGLAALAGAFVTATWRRAPGPGLALAGVAVGAAVAANPALWNGTSVPSTFTEKAPSAYELHAARVLDSSGGPSAVLGLPGQPFASTFSSTTVDPLWPGLLTRPFVTREQQVMGSLPTVDLLYGLDDPIQGGVEDPRALVALARLMGVGDVLVQNDLAFTRYDQPDPAVLWSALLTRPAGLGAPVGFGPRRPALNRSKVVDEQTYTLPADLPPMPSLAVLAVTGARSPVRVESAARPVVVDGDGVGVADVADTGLLAGNPTLLYAGTLDVHGTARRVSLQPGATLVVTDTNRRQAFRWDQIGDVAGATLAAGQRYPTGANDHPLDIFPGAPADAQTTTEVTGVSSVTASSYGNPFQYLPEDRPVQAIDGDPDTAWQVGPFLDPRGQWWQVRLLAPLRAGAVTLVQPQVGRHDQWITAVTLRFDGGSPLRVRLGPASRRPTGQVVRFSPRTFRTLRVTIDATNLSPAETLAGGVSAVGLAEVELPGVRAHEQVVMPSDLLRRVGGGSVHDRLMVVMTRLRTVPATSRTDPETALDRVLWLPTARTFTLTGTARLHSTAPDHVVDALVGRPGTGAGGVVADSSGRLQGDVADTASAALDGNPSTVWSSPLGDGEQIGQSITVRMPHSVTVDHLDLRVVVDGRHSVPSRLRISGDSGSAVVSIPRLPRQGRPDGSDPVTVRFPAISGRHLRITVLAIRPLRAVDYYAGGDVTLPVALAELGIPGVHVGAPPPSIPSPCRHDLLEVDGRPVWISVSGSSAAALGGGGLAVSLCGPDAGGLSLGAGPHTIVATPGRLSGIDLDQLVLDSAPGGGPQPGDGPDGVVPAPTPPAPVVRVVRRSSTTLRAVVEPTGGFSPGSAAWLVLGESVNSGWRASVVGGSALGPPRLVDGYANGWLLPSSVLARSGRGGRTPVTVVLTWTPQASVNVALVVSAVAGALCLVVALWPRRRRRGSRTVAGTAAGTEPGDPQLTGLGDEAPPGQGLVGRPSGARVAAASIGAGVVAGAVLVPAAGPAVALAVAGACLIRRGRVVLALAAVAGMLATAVVMVVVEGVGGYPGNGQWPSHFEAAAVVTWLALALAVAEASVRAARARRARPPGPEASPPPSPTS